jgi:putative transcriptional regulator
MSNIVLRNNLKVLRAKHNLTQEQLSERVEVTRITINCVERGKWIPSTVLSLKIARVFGVPLEEAFYLEELTAVSDYAEGLTLKKV